MLRKSCVLALAAFLLAAAASLAADQAEDILSKLDKATTAEGKAAAASFESLAEDIEKNPADAARQILPKLQDKNLAERKLALYIWALGLAKDPTSADALIDLHRKSSSSLVKQNSLRALATIGGKKAGAYLLFVLDAIDEKDMRFNILNLLAQMQCEEALPKMDEVLEQDPEKFFWQPIFVFGKMGDAAVPYLLDKIGDKDRNVRLNAINVLGTWLVAPEAAKPLEELYWKETDVGIRGVILGSLFGIVSNMDEIQSFCEKVAAKEKEEELVKFAKDAIANMDRAKASIAAGAKEKKISSDAFEKEYTKLFKSAGKKGDPKTIFAASTIQDEPKLKKLRERILQRDSDEAFYDYQKINEIIVRNRMIGLEKN